MFPITLERTNGTVLTTHPPCYGFLRDEEWGSWGQTWHYDKFALRYIRRSRSYGSSGMTDENPFAGNVLNNSWEDGDENLPSHTIDLSELKTIWNSGAHVPVEFYIEGKTTPSAYKFADEQGSNYKHTLAELERPYTSLDTFNMMHKGLFVTIKQVMADMEAAIDKGRESCLVWKDDSDMMGVNVVNIPCDRVLFYLMLNRELESFHVSRRTITFLDLHYVKNIPIMIALLMSRIIKETDEGYKFAADNNDSCLIPSQNLWVGMGHRYLQPVAIDWSQHSYTEGRGHLRDDDIDGYDMEPEIRGYTNTNEDFNSSMFEAIIGGVVDSRTTCLLDRAGGNNVANLVSEFFRAVAPKDLYRVRGSNGYCSYWTSERALYEEKTQELCNPETWVKTLLSLLTEE